jgi:hypothetical protein
MKFDLKLTVDEAAKMAGVAVSSLRRWKKQDPKLFEVIWRGCLERKLDHIRANLGTHEDNQPYKGKRVYLEG